MVLRHSGHLEEKKGRKKNIRKWIQFDRKKNESNRYDVLVKFDIHILLFFK